MPDAVPSRPTARLIDSARVGPLQIGIVVLVTVVILLAGVDSIAIGLVGTGMAATAHVPVASITVVYLAGEIGFLIGGVSFGPLADRFGHKPVLLLTVVLFGLFTLLTAYGSTLGVLFLFRLLTGVGLGGATPVALSLVTEYVPQRLRATLTAVAWAGFPAGGVVIGIAAGVVLPHGWQLLFIGIGVASLVVAVLLAFGTPESLDYMVRHHASERRVDRVVRRLRKGSDIPITTGTLLTVESNPALMEFPNHTPSDATVRYLFTERRAARTVLLWAVFGCTFLPLVFLGDWTPALLESAGETVALAGLAITVYSIGSMVGSAVVGRLMAWLGDRLVLIVSLALACVTFVILALLMHSSIGVLIAITAVGLFSGAAQSGVITFAALLYPTSLRATGLSWAVSAGRAVSALGPVIGGSTIAAGWPPSASVALIAVFPLAGVLFVLAIQRAGALRVNSVVPGVS